MVQSTEPEPKVDFERRRTIALWVSFACLALVPLVGLFVTRVAVWVVSEIFYFGGASDIALTLVYYLDSSLWTICAYQVLIWWLWKPHKTTPFPVGVPLLLTAVGASVAATQLQSVFYLGWDEFWGQTLVQMAMTSAQVALDFVILAAAGALIQFRFVDQGATSVGQHGLGADVKRSSWSLRGFFAATFVAAVMLACVKWSHRVYAEDLDLESHPSEASYAIFYFCIGVANALCILAAANRYVTRTSGLSWLMLIGSIALDWLGLFVWLWLLPEDAWAFDNSYYVGPVLNVIVIYGGTRWLLGRWASAGYALYRSRSLIST